MDENQSPIAESFIALYVSPGRTRPNAARAEIGARYELCEDMAQMLTEHAGTLLFSLSITEDLVLDRIHQGLLAEGSVVGADEAWWVTRRLAELLAWPQPEKASDGHLSIGDLTKK